MDGAQVGVLEQTHQVGLSSLLQGQDGGGLETQVGLVVLGDLTDQTLEGQLADQQLRGLLVLTDLTQSDGSGSIPVGLLDTTGGGGRLAGGLGGQLLTGSLSSGGPDGWKGVAGERRKKTGEKGERGEGKVRRKQKVSLSCCADTCIQTNRQEEEIDMKKCMTYLRAVCLVRAIFSIDKRKIMKRKGKASEFKNGVGWCVFDGRRWRQFVTSSSLS